MRFHRWGRVVFASQEWEHHAFPSFGRPDYSTTLCGKHYVGSARPQRGTMKNVCEECACLVRGAEAAAVALEAQQRADEEALATDLRADISVAIRDADAAGLRQVLDVLRVGR